MSDLRFTKYLPEIFDTNLTRIWWKLNMMLKFTIFTLYLPLSVILGLNMATYFHIFTLDFPLTQINPKWDTKITIANTYFSRFIR